MTITSRLLLPLLALTLAAQADNWPQWRGPAFNGTSADKLHPLAKSLLHPSPAMLSVTLFESGESDHCQPPRFQ